MINRYIINLLTILIVLSLGCKKESVSQVDDIELNKNSNIQLENISGENIFRTPGKITLIPQIVTTNLILRIAPGTSSEQVDLLHEGTPVLIMENGPVETINNIESQWVKVIQIDGTIGWCFKDYIKEIDNRDLIYTEDVISDVSEYSTHKAIAEKMPEELTSEEKIEFIKMFPEQLDFSNPSDEEVFGHWIEWGSIFESDQDGNPISVSSVDDKVLIDFIPGVFLLINSDMTFEEGVYNSSFGWRGSVSIEGNIIEKFSKIFYDDGTFTEHKSKYRYAINEGILKLINDNGDIKYYIRADLSYYELFGRTINLDQIFRHANVTSAIRSTFIVNSDLDFILEGFDGSNTGKVSYTFKIKRLIGSAINVNFQNIFGQTALHFAAMNGDLEVIRLLLDSGADKTIRDIANQTPFDVIYLLNKDGDKSEIQNLLK